MSGRSLKPEENDRVVAAIRAMLAGGETQSSLGPKLGVQQSTLSSLLQGRHNAGYNLARSVARLLRRPVEDLLQGEAASSGRWKMWRELPGWEETFAEAKRLHPVVSDAAWEWLESLCAPTLPLHDARGFGELAAAWDHNFARSTTKAPPFREPTQKTDIHRKVPSAR